MALTLFDTSIDSWCYLCEGGKNILFWYNGTNPKLIGTLLRIPKSSEKSRTPLISIDSTKFFCSLFSRLLGGEYLPEYSFVNILYKFAFNLVDLSKHKRPLYRRSQNIAVTKSEFLTATLVSNLAYMSIFNLPQSHFSSLPCLCVEIKSKCGRLYTSPVFNQSHIKRFKCRYCMHQELKYHQGKIDCISSYCPMEIFSQNSDRIFNALKSLFKSPQNNLRLFFNDSTFIHMISLSEQTQLNNAILTVCPFLKQSTSNSDTTLTDIFLELLSDIIYQSPLFSKILSIQSLDQYGIEFCYHTYQELLKRSKNNEINECSLLSDSDNIDSMLKQFWCFETRDKWVESLVKLLDNLNHTMDICGCSVLSELAQDLFHKWANENNNNMNLSQECFNQNDVCKNVEKSQLINTNSSILHENIRLLLSKLPSSDLIVILKNYLLATTAKDLSILISITKHTYNSEKCNTICNNHIDYRMKVIDIDERQMSPVEMNYQLQTDKNVVNYYMSQINK